MKAAYVCSDRGVPIFGSKGCSLHVQEVARAFTQTDIDVDFHVASIGGECPKDLHQLDVHRIKHAKISDRALREQADIQDNAAIMSQLIQCEPYDFIYERYSLWSHAGMSYAASKGIPAILEVNAPLVEEQQKYRGLVDEQAARDITQQCFSSASLILAVSEQVADYVDTYPQAHDKVKVLPNGVNTERFICSSAERSITDHLFTFGFVGTLKPWHGVDRLIEAFAIVHTHFPNTRLIIIGDGPMRQTLELQVAHLKLESSVEIVGMVAPSDMAEMYTQMDVGVAPYPSAENFYFSPLKIYEYMAAGLAVIASDIGQIPQIVTDHKTGLTCSSSSITSLIEAMEFLADNHTMAMIWGKIGQDEAQRYHSWQSRVENILNWSGLTVERSNGET
ncbi:glycosyltransferase family 4 protein [Vibrio bivalvicida]|uniref:Glycosyl transferase family 1 n=1 Tax=Vibrio bivalvicida TaxID=1276888 RepID=A0A177XXE0_9VIBR|nr:glycosyltransferase family 4 protein [Vibrio bivalvicida]OAJ93272.1 glycosyl transferase family 1 [Vibrio bivalvicida]